MKRLNGWIKGAAFSQGCKESGSSSYGDRRLRSGPCAGLRFDAFKEGACWTHSQRLKFSSTPSICGMSALVVFGGQNSMGCIACSRID
eukprot:scaffold42839_cov18-Tisochrysis_lutea.AAC.1